MHLTLITSCLSKQLSLKNPYFGTNRTEICWFINKASGFLCNMTIWNIGIRSASWIPKSQIYSNLQVTGGRIIEFEFLVALEGGAFNSFSLCNMGWGVCYWIVVLWRMLKSNIFCLDLSQVADILYLLSLKQDGIKMLYTNRWWWFYSFGFSIYFLETNLTCSPKAHDCLWAYLYHLGMYFLLSVVTKLPLCYFSQQR